MEVSYDLLRERAGRGAALLDERSPGWWRTLVPESIHQAFGATCVVGSLNPDVDYYAMLDELEVQDVAADEPGTVVWYGFDLLDTEYHHTLHGCESFSRLTDVWRNLIAERQLKAGLR